MRAIILILCCVWILSACTQQDVINSGVSSPYHDCNMMDYMRGDTYNWELTVQMIEHAGLTDLFEYLLIPYNVLFLIHTGMKI